MNNAIEEIKKEILNIPRYDYEGNSMPRSTFTDLVFDILDEYVDTDINVLSKEPDYKAMWEDLKSGKYNNIEKFNINILRLKDLMQDLEKENGVKDE